MNISKIQELFESQPNIAISCDSIQKHSNIQIKGLQGSAHAMYIAAIFNKNTNCILFVADDEEKAGYIYHDLCQILDTDNVLFFPSAYKRAIKYGQIDSANEILRTEVLSELQTDNTHQIIVTYPEALAEKVISKETLKDNTLKINVSEKIDPQFVSEVLDSYGFEYTDYVYEPGQYAIRGSIIDVFSFSNEFPYRIDFFGDEVETIRPFDVENQLSGTI